MKKKMLLFVFAAVLGAKVNAAERHMFVQLYPVQGSRLSTYGMILDTALGSASVVQTVTGVPERGTTLVLTPIQRGDTTPMKIEQPRAGRFSYQPLSVNEKGYRGLVIDSVTSRAWALEGQRRRDGIEILDMAEVGRMDLAHVTDVLDGK
jgi:hypothetical protein